LRKQTSPYLGHVKRLQSLTIDKKKVFSASIQENFLNMQCIEIGETTLKAHKQSMKQTNKIKNGFFFQLMYSETDSHEYFQKNLSI